MFKLNNELTLLLINEPTLGLLLYNKQNKDDHTLMLKQKLFANDPDSFYGLAYSIKDFSVTKNDEKTSYAGIWFPLNKVSALFKLYKNQNVLLDECSTYLIEHLMNVEELANTRKVIPTRDANWSIDKSVSQSNPPLFPYMVERGETGLKIKRMQEEDWKQFIHSFIQYMMCSTSLYESHVKPYVDDLLSTETNEAMTTWTKSLQIPLKCYTLSQHLYPLCLKKWNGKTDDPFQVVLLIHEPEAENSPWTIELYMKEWVSEKIVPIKSLFEGDHPFLVNPFPYYKMLYSNIKNIVPINRMCFDTPTLMLSLEELTDLLMHKTDEIEAASIAILIPDRWKENHVIPQAKGVIYSEEEGSNSQSTNWRNSKISLSFLIDNHEISEFQFKQWVEEKRQLIFFNNHWVKWDLLQAEKLLKEYELASVSEELIYDVWRQTLAPNNLEEQRSDATIQWCLDKSVLNTFSLYSHHQLEDKWSNTLRSYQKEGALWLLKMRAAKLGACLADDMGLGKTVQTIAYLETVKLKENENQPFLIVCPTSLVENWVSEIQSFAPSFTFYVHAGKPSERRAMLQNCKVDIIISSYPLTLRDSQYFEKQNWSALILDEAQRIKNVNSKQRKAIKNINSNHKIALTGTPIENEPKEIWSLIDLLNPGFLRDEEWFTKNFLTNKNVEQALDKLKTLVNPFILRRTKKQFKHELMLPNKKEIKHIIALTKEQKVLYEAVVEELLEDLPSYSMLEKRSRLFQAITQLKQICNHPAHFTKESNIANMKGRSNKWDTCMSLLAHNQVEAKQTLLFTQYRYIGNLLQKAIAKELNTTVPFFHGQLSMKDRQNMITSFQAERRYPVMIISLRAGGFGLNLTNASEVIHYDRWWNPAVEDQATDRVYRIGQKRDVTVHTFISEGTIEQKLDNLLQEKKALQQSLLQSTSVPLWELNDTEIASLLKLR
ncbi:DEAD/DEAH box helicase [Evansella cellulosilytica]|uniref:SNF2-related protein n=1 Tax=Evansella cellulosilytica (strain ATCC 21833 / DSM 2522 / FERM P-1141 / JCM 9156 / N-4) TaxID=649639 RepID=E6TXZ3_EVAC2|nr:DEAD/DEAH box helicase [Evansella cellulosilytica]ADU31206.1 SNF2-related protein [Evansella cellulosilytica DSM 2522]